MNSGKMRLGVALMATVMTVATAHALSNYPGFIPNGNSRQCINCHISNMGGGPRNAFGVDVFNTRMGGIPNWATLYSMDSDQDGATNGEELGDPCGCWRRGTAPMFNVDITLPGDANSIPADRQVDCTNACAASSSSSSGGSGSLSAAASSGSSSGGAAEPLPGCGGTGDMGGQAAPALGMGLLGAGLWRVRRRNGG